MATAPKKSPATTKNTSSTTKATVKKSVAVAKTAAKATPAPTVKKATLKPAVAKETVKKIPTAKPVPAESKPAKIVASTETKASESKNNSTAISPEQRYHMIATAAYFKAQQRGFAAGYHVQDWITAEKEIDAKFIVK
jgi:glucan-binding YG repeat protein